MVPTMKKEKIYQHLCSIAEKGKRVDSEQSLY